MAGVTDTQSLRFGQVSDVITHTMVRDLADDIAVQLDAADAARLVAQKRPVAWARRALTAQSLPVGLPAVITFDQELVDTHSMIDLATQPTRITCGATAGTGIYLVQVNLVAFMAAWGRGDLGVRKNGTTPQVQKAFISPLDLVGHHASMLINFAATTDYVEMTTYHESGGATNTSVAWMRVTKITN